MSTKIPAPKPAQPDGKMQKIESATSVLQSEESDDKNNTSNLLTSKVAGAWAAASGCKAGAAQDEAVAAIVALLPSAKEVVESGILNLVRTTLEDSNKKGANARVAGIVLMLSLTDGIKPSATFEPIALDFLVPMLKVCGDPYKPAREAAEKAVAAVTTMVNPHAFSTVVLPALLECMDHKLKWQTVVNSLQLFEAACAEDRSEAAHHAVRCTMPDAVPAILPLMTDFKAEVAAAATKTVEAACSLVSNRDLEPLLPKVVGALGDIKLRAECVFTLASTTFVSTVDAAALTIIMPLLVHGFSERETSVKRQCARIVVNMLKLVEDPAEARSFLPILEKTLEKAMKEVSDPEARGVCEQAHAQICRLRDSLSPALPDVDARAAKALDLIKGSLSGLVETAESKMLLGYSARLCSALAGENLWDVAAWELCTAPYFELFVGSGAAVAATPLIKDGCHKAFGLEAANAAEAEEDDGAEELCNCKFTLAYGSKILLHNTKMRLMRGHHYGLLGGNDSGKTTLMRAIANDQVDGFPPSTVLRTVFVEADILGELSHLSCLEYVFEDERIKACGVTKERVEEALSTVGFVEDGKARPNDPVSTLSGGWRMKLALARAMLQNADILLMDEPTNHLDVINVDWVIKYLQSLRGVTSIIVSHDKKLLNDVCTDILQIDSLKLKPFKGNLEAFVVKHPSAQAYFDFKASKLKFTFPQPGPIEGIKSKSRALMKMDDVEFTYPGNTKPTISRVTVRASMASRVACVGVNGAGKSTMIKLLTGEMEPSKGTVWKHPACRVGYIAQHAFHHIEQHLNKTANEYIQWRYQNGDDKETLDKITMVITEEEQKKCEAPVTLEIKNPDSGAVTKEKRVVEKLTGARRAYKKEHEYEIKWQGRSMDSNTYMNTTQLTAMGFAKHMKHIDEKVAIRAGMYTRPATKSNVEKHLDNVGLSAEFGTHHRMSALSGGQKVKVVLAASLWNQPHILILDEPTNYLDRESLGALASAVREYDGGVVMITHNADFCADLCPETWVLEHGTLDCRGDPEWMAAALKDQNTPQVQLAAEDMVDALGNKVKVKSKKKLSNKEKKAKAKQRAFKIANGIDVSSEDEDF